MQLTKLELQGCCSLMFLPFSISNLVQLRELDAQYGAVNNVQR